MNLGWKLWNSYILHKFLLLVNKCLLWLQLDHRILATTTLISIGALWWSTRRLDIHPAIRSLIGSSAGMASLQVRVSPQTMFYVGVNFKLFQQVIECACCNCCRLLWGCVLFCTMYLFPWRLHIKPEPWLFCHWWSFSITLCGDHHQPFLNLCLKLPKKSLANWKIQFFSFD